MVTHRPGSVDGRRAGRSLASMDLDMEHELTTQRLLTMEWVDGVRIRSAGEDPSVGRALAREDMKLVGVRAPPF